ncbi:MAG: hypothetical protein VB051_00070 [Candidatus Pelethousia sp.]|nr:hypothetical protein [Candidatus Pelethousia sp.]
MKKFLVSILALAALFCLPSALAAQAPADGNYTIEATLSGGSGRASVASPAALAVRKGVATATVVWSSPYYEYMLLDGAYYYPIQSEGNATFAIPVRLDEDMPFAAQTIAMSEPHEVQYTLRFDSTTLKPLSGGGQTIAVIAVSIAAVLIPPAVFIIARHKKGAQNSRIGT